ncbi:hypothetical protein HUK65_15515 [Rhodobacteraceae bacterium 2376]|uniref:Uncharacterized protein n=2 Tax=Rhabdonatronobacter sediminivivens TaxID=2743469 RepID=A0A7Z0I1T9_9RHOB|nr:hypothetical protein [Rhabdonatronobacter sediminivivens]
MTKVGVKWAFPDDTEPDSLVYAPTTPDEIFGLVLGEKIIANSSGEAARFGVPIEDLPTSVGHATRTRVFREIYRACANKRAVLISYVARSGVNSYVFSPHTLVRAGPRLHFRGHVEGVNEGRSGFVDIVPSRTVSVDTSKSDRIGVEGDLEWERRVDLEFALNSSLPQPILDQVMIEHGGAPGGDPNTIQLKVSRVRSALALYVTREVRHRWFGDQLLQVWLPCSQGEKMDAGFGPKTSGTTFSGIS